MTKDMLRTKLQEALQDVKDKKARRQVVDRLKEYLCHQEKLQRMPYVHRAVFWKCNYHLFDYLRTNGQIQREAGDFDGDVKEILKELL